MGQKKQSRINTLTRRSVIAGLAAVPFIAGCSPRKTWSTTEADVLVIGAGIAGLSAALTLEEQGYKVSIVEADTRLGGRCHTLHLESGYYDCGATTIGPAYGRIRTFAHLADVELIAPPSRDGFSYHINDMFVGPNEWESSKANKLIGDERRILPQSLEFTLVQGFNKIDSLYDWNAPEMLQYDVRYDDFLLNNGLSPEAIRLISMTSNSMSMSETSALFQMREFARLALPNSGKNEGEVYAAAGRKNYHYVKGGTSNLIDGMAGLLKAEPRLNAPVTAIDVSEGGIEAHLKNGDRIAAKSVICTIPYSALGKVKITPTLTGNKLNAVSKAQYTTTTHIFCRPKRAYWDDDGHPAGLVTDGLLDRVFANKGTDGKVAWLDVWLNGTNASQLDGLSEAERNQKVLTELARVRPSTTNNLDIVGSYSWGNNPYIKGNKQVLAPGQVGSVFPFMASPWMNRLRFAGEHTRTVEAGLEAAAESGMREALAVMESVL